MATEPIIAALAVARPHAYGGLADYWALTKPEVNVLIVITTLAGFYLGYPAQSHQVPFLLPAHTLLGTLLIASGAGTLNQFVERHFDAAMRRTSRRPLPSGRVEPAAALGFGLVLSLAGAFYLAVLVNALVSVLAVLTLTTYIFLYTPLKRTTPLCTFAGAIPGAMPPLIGWAAASGKLSVEGCILYAILFLWQFPHFMAIAWMYREDYDRGGYLVLPAGEQKGRFMAWQTAVPLLALLPLSMMPTLLEHAGRVYLTGAFILSGSFLYSGVRLVIDRSNLTARRLLFASIIYLPLLFVLMVIDKR